MLEYSTTDIVLAAYLKVKGCDLTRIEKQGHQGTFVFKNVLPSLLSEYDLGKASVEPVAFNSTIKQLTTSVKRMG